MPTVSNLVTKQTIEVEKNETLCDAFERQGLNFPHGCLAGVCSACIFEVVKGDENILPLSGIEKKTIENYQERNPQAKEQMLRLGCRAKIIGDINFKK